MGDPEGADAVRESRRPFREANEDTLMRRAGRLRLILILALGAGAVALAVSFVDFAAAVAERTAPEAPQADGIVVLTGGSARIDAGLDLLAEGRAERLLISGVNPAVGADALADVLANDPTGPLSCCIDLGHAARDTIGNAVETGAWARDNGYDSLIVVTSDYHLPRALAELSAAMPETRLVGYPVHNHDLDFGTWWSQPDAVSLLTREYIKLLAARLRMAVGPGASP